MKFGPKLLGIAVIALAIGAVIIWQLGKQGAQEPVPREEVGNEPQSEIKDGVAVIAPAEKVWKELDDPSADGWGTEVITKLIKDKLDGLAKRIVSGELEVAALAEFVAEDVEGSLLVPSDSRIVWSGGDKGVKVKRGESAAKVDYKGIGSLAGSLERIRETLGGSAEQMRCTFKVVGIEREGARLLVRVLVECAGQGAEGIVEQHAEWVTTWRMNSEADDARLVHVILDRFEQSERPAKMFEDCTESVLGANESYQKQLLFGAPHWLQRIQDTRQMTLLGTPGTALGDVNGDGLDDLYLCQPGGLPNRLFVQLIDGTLRDVTEESGTGWLESSRSALFVDLDNDGDQDLVVAAYARLVLAKNNGSGVYEVAAIEEIGIGAMGVSAADYDDDKDLDLYVCHYSKGDLDLEAGATVIGSGGRFVYHDANNAGRNYLFRNDLKDSGAQWVFADVTEAVGLEVNNRRFTLAAAWEDFDNDGDQDLYVANDFGRNNLYRNDEGRFVDIAPEVQGEDRASGMSVSWGDVNRDGWMDLYIANMFSAAGKRIAPQEEFSPGSSEEVRSALLRFARGNTMLQQSEGRFADVSEELGVTMGRWAWSSMFADLNNDGWEDLLVANGYITTPDPGDL